MIFARSVVFLLVSQTPLLVAFLLFVWRLELVVTLIPRTEWSPLVENGRNGLNVTVSEVYTRSDIPRTEVASLTLAPVIPYGLALARHPPFRWVTPTVLPKVLWNPHLLRHSRTLLPRGPTRVSALVLIVLGPRLVGIPFLKHPRARIIVSPMKPLRTVISLSPPCDRKLPYEKLPLPALGVPVASIQCSILLRLGNRLRHLRSYMV